MHTVWWHVIRLIMAAHFHTHAAHIHDIEYWAPHNLHSSDPSYGWHYDNHNCNYHVWGRYDVCIGK